MYFLSPDPRFAVDNTSVVTDRRAELAGWISEKIISGAATITHLEIRQGSTTIAFSYRDATRKKVPRDQHPAPLSVYSDGERYR